MTDIEILHEMLQDNAKMKIEFCNGKHQVNLIDPQLPDVVVAIREIPEESIVIRADAFASPSSFFKGQKGECKRADFVIVADSGKKKVAIFIEMKRRKDSGKEIVQQLKGARSLLLYCQEVGRAFWEQQEFLKGYQHRFVSIGHLSMSKHKTRMSRPSGIHDQPEKLMKVDWPNKQLQFNQLAGGF